MRKVSFTFAVLFLLTLSAILPISQASDNAATTKSSNGDNWNSFTLNYVNSRYNPNAGINSSNVGGLELKWFDSTGEAVSATPIVNDGVVYFDDWGGNVWAVSLNTGAVIWEDQFGPKNPFSSTPAIAYHSLYVASIDSSIVYSLNLTTGSVLWTTQINQDKQMGIWASPILYQGRLFIGIASLGNETNPANDGFIDALNATTGAILWTFNTMIGTSGGAGVWSSVVIDTKTDRIFFGTSNPYSSTNSTLYTDSVICLDASTGKLVWYYQTIPDDTHDDDIGSTPNLFTISIDDKPVKVVGVGQKNGYYYIFDRNNGTLIEKISFGLQIIGLTGFIPSSPLNTELFVPVRATEDVNATCCGALAAFFPSNDTKSWSYPAGKVVGSVGLVPGAVLVGDEMGYLYAISTSTGDLLYQTQIPYSIADGVTVAQNYVLVGNYPFVSVTNKTQLGLYAFCISC